MESVSTTKRFEPRDVSFEFPTVVDIQQALLRDRVALREDSLVRSNHYVWSEEKESGVLSGEDRQRVRERERERDKEREREMERQR